MMGVYRVGKQGRFVALLFHVWLTRIACASQIDPVEQNGHLPVSKRSLVGRLDDISGWLQNLLGSGSLSSAKKGAATAEDYYDTGAEVFRITFSDADIEKARSGDISVLVNNLNITKVTEQNGISGNPRNRYIWSMELDDNDQLYVGTLNANKISANTSNLIWSVLKAPSFQQIDAAVDALLRQWSGSPMFETDGGQIYSKPTGTDEFTLALQADPDHVGFRKMINYNGFIYAGSANGPEGPYDGDPYDFSFYESNVGAKIFTNAGGTFEILNDKGFLDGYDKTIRAMVVSSYSNRLFIGTETYKCAKIVIYNDKPDATPQWKKIDVENMQCTHSISQLTDLGNGKILFGVWKTFGYGVFLLDETNGDTLTELTTPQYWLHISQGVMEISVFNNQLYLGITSFVRGFALVRTWKVDDLLNLKDDDWELVTDNGFQKEQQDQLDEIHHSGNDYTWSSKVAHGMYFIGTFAGSAQQEVANAQLWASTDGLNWKVIQSDVFQSSRYMYGFRTMALSSDEKTLYIGSATNMYIPGR